MYYMKLMKKQKYKGQKISEPENINLKSEGASPYDLNKYYGKIIELKRGVVLWNKLHTRKCSLWAQQKFKLVDTDASLVRICMMIIYTRIVISAWIAETILKMLDISI